MPYKIPEYMPGLDTPRIPIVIRDMSGGMNSRINNTEIEDNQGELLQNIDISTPGKSTKMPGSVQLAGTQSWGTNPVYTHSYIIQGQDDQILALEGSTLRNWASGTAWTVLGTAFDSSSTEVGYLNCKQSGVAPDDVCMIQTNEGDQYVLKSDGTLTDISSGTAAPQETTVMAWYQNRVWTLKNDELEFSDAVPSDYATAFNNTKFRVPVGDERAIISTRDFGMVIGGANQIWGLAPSVTPDATSDQPFPIIQDKGVVSKKAMVNFSDDVFWFAEDGLRSLKRNIQDKLQQQASYPVSYPLKTEFEEIIWSRKNEIEVTGWDNKIFCKVPVAGGTKLWVYYPATQAWAIKTGLYVNTLTPHSVDGEARLYYGHRNDGKVYRAWYGFSDEGTTVSDGTASEMKETGKNHDCGNPLVNKYGGEVEVVVQSTSGINTVEIWASFNDGEFTKIGELDIQQLTGADFGVTGLGTVTFPVTFADSVLARGKFHLDSYGQWKTIQLELIHDTVASADISVVSRNIITFIQEYLMED
jgi:hypothetical protein